MRLANKQTTGRKIPPEVFAFSRQKLDGIISMFEPYLVTLTDGERQALAKMEEGLFSFLELSHGLAVEYPQLFPAFVHAAMFNEEFSTISELRSFINTINNLRDSLTDTEMLTGNHALDLALAFYQTVKIAARRDIPCARVIYEELKPTIPSGISRRVPAGRKRRKAASNDRQPELF